MALVQYMLCYIVLKYVCSSDQALCESESEKFLKMLTPLKYPSPYQSRMFGKAQVSVRSGAIIYKYKI
jgi:hypothetical protein